MAKQDDAAKVATVKIMFRGVEVEIPKNEEQFFKDKIAQENKKSVKKVIV
jgi:hypothetical protein